MERSSKVGSGFHVAPHGLTDQIYPHYVQAYNDWGTGRKQKREEWEQKRAQWGQACASNLPAQVGVGTVDVLKEIERLDKLIQECRQQEVADLKQGIALMEQVIPLIDTAPLDGTEKRDAKRNMTLQLIKTRTDLLQVLRDCAMIPCLGGEAGLLQTFSATYRTAAECASDAAWRFAIRAEVTTRRRYIPTEELLSTTGRQAEDLERFSRYLEPKTKQEYDELNCWIRDCAKVQVPGRSVHLLVLQLKSRPACHELEARALECLSDIVVLTSTFLWACHPEKVGQAVHTMKDPHSRLIELAVKQAKVADRIDVLQGMNSQFQNLKLKLSEVRKACEDFIDTAPAALPKKILDDVQETSQGIDNMQISTDEMLERLLLEAPAQPGEPPPAAAFSTAVKGKPKQAGAVRQPTSQLAPTVSKPAEESMLKIDTPDGILVAPGKVSADQEGGEVVELTTGSRYQRHKTMVLGRTVWRQIHTDGVLAKIEQDAAAESKAACNLAPDVTIRSSAGHEHRLRRVIARAKELLLARQAKEKSAQSLENEVNYRVTPSGVASYLGPYLASLDEAREVLDKRCRQLDAAAPASKSESAKSLEHEAQACIDDLQQAADALRQLGWDAAIRIFKKQPPTSKGLEFLIENGVRFEIEVTAVGRKLGPPPTQPGETTTGARLKQTRETPQPRNDYLTACRLTIMGDDTPACCAHFHYDNATAANTDYCAAHLKTLAQEFDTNRPRPLADLPAGQRAPVHYAALRHKTATWIFEQVQQQTQPQAQP